MNRSHITTMRQEENKSERITPAMLLHLLLGHVLCSLLVAVTDKGGRQTADLQWREAMISRSRTCSLALRPRDRPVNS